jgi:uncharacterized circularly permuted ATP-grasp superfamily protein/uncharacterized alpha-E superfamily protein
MMTMTEGIGTHSGDPFANYAVNGSRFDEMLDENGRIRDHWTSFIERFRSFSPEEQASRSDKLRRLARETGIAHDLFSEAHSADEPWRIDLIPLMISPQEWQFLEGAINQRARLSAAILEDLYGGQKILQNGHVPPQLILDDPSFLRPMNGAAPGRGRLAFYAADLVRDAQGNWRIIDTHTETIAGIGFALANRLVQARVSGDLFLDTKALRLAHYFSAMNGELHARAGRDDAPIALLTPGAHHEDYFGHAFLARYLSLLLVEGGDLRVVGNRLYMKTLEGLRPINLILRCVASELSDPLQLDPGGYLGPAGLVQAVRANPDMVVNGLGTAILENRGLGPYLPGLCHVLLGESLAIEDQPRLWLGAEAAKQALFDPANQLAIRPAQEGTGRPGRPQSIIFPSALSQKEHDELLQRVRLTGFRYVAEKPSTFATGPSWTPDGIVPESCAVRLFATIVDGEYRAMPGGIALPLDTSSDFGLYAAEGRSRDIWVTSDVVATSYPHRLRTSLEAPKISRGGTGLRSRIADNLFWLGRYAERADWIMRLLRGALNRLDPDATVFQNRETIVNALDILLAKDDELVALQQKEAAIEQRARALMSGRGRNYGLVQTLGNLYRVAGLIRDRLSVELWHTLQVFQASPIWTGDLEPQSLTEALDHLDEGIATLAAFNGMAAENMTRNYGWTFLEIGRRSERASNLAELLANLFGERQDEATESASLTFALEVADSILTYRSRYLFAPVLPLVLDLLVGDETNPRSVGFQLSAISDHLDDLPKGPQQLPQSEERKIILDMQTQVRLADVYDLSKADQDGRRPAFNTLFKQLVAELPQLSEAITRRYFSLTEDEMTRINPSFGTRP